MSREIKNLHCVCCEEKCQETTDEGLCPLCEKEARERAEEDALGEEMEKER